MSFHYRYRKQIIIGIIILVLLGLVTFFIVNRFIKSKDKTTDSVNIVKKKEIKKKKDNIQSINYFQVDIKGEVNIPGIYKLEENSRVIDVINKAGGLTENANTSVINLSKKISDEMVIIIYSNSQVEDFSKTKEIENQVIDYCNQVDENSLHNDACISSDNDTVPTSKVSINTAGVEELMTLPGVGEAKAKSIIEYREANGPFNTIEDITKVSGIGDNLFAQIKEFITT